MVLYKTISFTKAGLQGLLAYSFIYFCAFPHHFPIQNVENRRQEVV